MKKHAFTLAEVLITLAVIGVVASITLPSVIKNYQKTVWTNQLKRLVSTFEQGFQRAMADEEVFDLTETQMYKNFYRHDYNYYTFLDYLRRYINMPKLSNDTNIQNNKNTTYKCLDKNEIYCKIGLNVASLYDGSYVSIWYSYDQDKNAETVEQIKNLGGHLYKVAFTLDIDVNGWKQPNVLGRDAFRFYVGSDGKLYPRGGIDYALYNQQTEISHNSNYWKNGNHLKCTSTSGSGSNNCAARIIENGWKMDY